MSGLGPVAAVGLDAGSTTMKLAAVDASGALVLGIIDPADPRLEVQAEALIARALAETATVARVPVVATGYGRNLVRRADRALTEITCHARGVFRATGHGGTLVDIGGQDTKVIVVGPDGAVANFAMNDKCAAGTGRFLEVIAGRLRLSLDELSSAALAGAVEVPVSSTCTVFAESEIISLLARGNELDPIVRGLHRAMVRRVVGLARSAGVRAPVMLSGGVARSAAVRALLAEELKTTIVVPPEPQLMGAYGAALVALGTPARA